MKVETILDLFLGIFNRTFLMWEYRERCYSLMKQYDAILPLIETGTQNPAPPAARAATRVKRAPVKAKQVSR